MRRRTKKVSFPPRLAQPFELLVVLADGLAMAAILDFVLAVADALPFMLAIVLADVLAMAEGLEFVLAVARLGFTKED